MRTVFWLVLSFLFSAAAIAAPSTCALTSAAPTAPATSAPAFCLPDRAACTSLPGGEMCSCMNEDGDFIDYRTVDGALVTRQTPGFPMFDPGSFLAFEGDVDGDGRVEQITARLTGISNGLGVSTWRVTVADGTRDFTWRVAEFGPDSFARRLDGKPGCRVLATEWISDGDGEPGTWFTGRWFNLHDDGLGLEPAGEGLRRRLLNSFDALWRKTAEQLEAATGLAGQGRPLEWLTDAKARAFDPTLPVPGQESVAVTVKLVEVRPDPGNDVDQVLTVVMTDAAGQETALPLRDLRIGLTEDRRLWPAGYVPADPAAWVGRQAVLVADPGQLWLRP